MLHECAAAGAHVVPQGGHTGMVGGATPRDGEIVLSTSRLHAIEELDEAAAQITVGAGTTLAALQTRVREHGLDFGVDHAARGTASIGGMTATNAGSAASGTDTSSLCGTPRLEIVSLCSSR